LDAWTGDIDFVRLRTDGVDLVWTMSGVEGRRRGRVRVHIGVPIGGRERIVWIESGRVVGFGQNH
jgi:hypothetical protein